MEESDTHRRRHQRLPIRTDVLCRKVGAMEEHIFQGQTVDISPDGLLVEGQLQTAMNAGDLCSIELDIPQIDGPNPAQISGKVSAYGRILRIVELGTEHKGGKKQIALEFCRRPHLDLGQ